jgi:ribosome maturation factor RimP
VYLEYQRGDRGVLRLFIDKLVGDAGVSIDDCAKVSRLLSPALDVENILDAAYVLEVSSPGVERRLTKATHFIRFRGKRARLSTSDPVDGRTSFNGIIAEANEKTVTMDNEGERIDVPYGVIAKANLEFEFGN